MMGNYEFQSIASKIFHIVSTYVMTLRAISTQVLNKLDGLLILRLN